MNEIQAAFNAILNNFLELKKKPFGLSESDKSVQAIKKICACFEKTDFVSELVDLKVKFSLGLGNWANIPWIALLDSKQASSIQNGRYCVYLFRQDMSGFYLCYGLGVSKAIDQLGRSKGLEAIKKQVELHQSRLEARHMPQFQISSEVDLRATSGIGTEYSHGTIAFKFYENGKVPEDSVLLNDLRILVETYMKSESLSKRYWAVGAFWDEEDKTEEFMNEGVWINGYTTKFLDKVNQVQVGDSIVIKSSFVTNKIIPVMRVKAMGRVIGTPKDGRTLKVAWQKNFSPFDLLNISKRETIHEVIDENEIQKIFATKNSNDESSTDLKLIAKENIILFGPPGTGKTFELKRKYLSAESVIDVQSDFDESLLEQSWYVLIALAIDFYGGKASVPEIVEHDLIKRKAIYQGREKNISQTVWGNLQLHSVRDSKTVKVEKRVGELIFDKTSDSLWYLVDGLPEMIRQLKPAMTGKQERKVTHLNKFVTFHQSFGYEEFVEGIKPLDENHHLNDSGESLTYKTVDGVFKQACKEALIAAGYTGGLDKFCELTRDERQAILAEAPTFNFCIDEINRANCAKVFGELITLIEADKRLGCENELVLSLPYSNEKFGVPANLRIIGTMNTADRSIEALDSALRRRFSFIEVGPKPNELKPIETISLKNILETINDRIEILADKDKAIGHAYLINIKNLAELKKTFKDNIVPLLCEYFYGDLEKVGLILGDKFVKVKRKSSDTLANFDTDIREDFNSRKLYQLANIDDMNIEDFESIYKYVA